LKIKRSNSHSCRTEIDTAYSVATTYRTFTKDRSIGLAAVSCSTHDSTSARPTSAASLLLLLLLLLNQLVFAAAASAAASTAA
jgi:hypothetical protein